MGIGLLTKDSSTNLDNPVGTKVEDNGSDYLCRTNSFTEFAGDASLLTGGVAPQSMLPTKPGTEGTLLKGVVDGGWLLEDHSQSHSKSWSVEQSRSANL